MKRWDYEEKSGSCFEINFLRSESMSQRGELKGPVVTKKHREENQGQTVGGYSERPRGTALLKEPIGIP